MNKSWKVKVCLAKSEKAIKLMWKKISIYKCINVMLMHKIITVWRQIGWKKMKEDGEKEKDEEEKKYLVWGRINKCDFILLLLNLLV